MGIEVVTSKFIRKPYSGKWTDLGPTHGISYVMKLFFLYISIKKKEEKKIENNEIVNTKFLHNR